MKTAAVAPLVLLLNGLAFTGFGLAFLLIPDTMMTHIDLEIPTPMVRTDMRAIYGGLEIGLGLWLLLACARPRLREAGLYSATLATGGLVCGRAYGLAMDGVDPTNPQLIASELAAFLLCAGALALTRGRSA